MRVSEVEGIPWKMKAKQNSHMMYKKTKQELCCFRIISKKMKEIATKHEP